MPPPAAPSDPRGVNHLLVTPPRGTFGQRHGLPSPATTSNGLVKSSVPPQQLHVSSSNSPRVAPYSSDTMSSIDGAEEGEILQDSQVGAAEKMMRLSWELPDDEFAAILKSMCEARGLHVAGAEMFSLSSAQRPVALQFWGKSQIQPVKRATTANLIPGQIIEGISLESTSDRDAQFGDKNAVPTAAGLASNKSRRYVIYMVNHPANTIVCLPIFTYHGRGIEAVEFQQVRQLHFPLKFLDEGVVNDLHAEPELPNGTGNHPLEMENVPPGVSWQSVSLVNSNQFDTFYYNQTYKLRGRLTDKSTSYLAETVSRRHSESANHLLTRLKRKSKLGVGTNKAQVPESDEVSIPAASGKIWCAGDAFDSQQAVHHPQKPMPQDLKRRRSQSLALQPLEPNTNVLRGCQDERRGRNDYPNQKQPIERLEADYGHRLDRSHDDVMLRDFGTPNDLRGIQQGRSSYTRNGYSDHYPENSRKASSWYDAGAHRSRNEQSRGQSHYQNRQPSHRAREHSQNRSAVRKAGSSFHHEQYSHGSSRRSDDRYLENSRRQGHHRSEQISDEYLDSAYLNSTEYGSSSRSKHTSSAFRGGRGDREVVIEAVKMVEMVKTAKRPIDTSRLAIGDCSSSGILRGLGSRKDDRTEATLGRARNNLRLDRHHS